MIEFFATLGVFGVLRLANTSLHRLSRRDVGATSRVNFPAIFGGQSPAAFSSVVL